MSQKDIVLLAAMSANRVIGLRGGMPWARQRRDIRRFRRITMGRPVIMGRKTFESIGSPLPDRLNIVMTRKKRDFPKSVLSASSVNEALFLAGKVSLVYVIGGGEIYRLFLPHCTGVDLTTFDCIYPTENAVLFPELPESEFPTVADSGWVEMRDKAKNILNEQLSYKLQFYYKGRKGQ